MRSSEDRPSEPSSQNTQALGHPESRTAASPQSPIKPTAQRRPLLPFGGEHLTGSRQSPAWRGNRNSAAGGDVVAAVLAAPSASSALRASGHDGAVMPVRHEDQVSASLGDGTPV